MKLYFLAIAGLVFLSACTPGAKYSSGAQTVEGQTHLLQSTLFVQHAAEYDALCIQAYEVAKMRLRAHLENGVNKPAVVLDLDETVLDNSPYTAWQIKSGEQFSPETWAKWVNLAEAEAIPGALEFLRFADSAGVALFYISNRDANQLVPTLKNMDALSMPQLAESQFMLKEGSSDKSSRRAAVIDRGYEIVLLIGDNLGDFSEKWDKPAGMERRKAHVNDSRTEFGRRYIILPNPIYGTWEGALNGYARNLSPAQIDSTRKTLLRSAPIR